MSKPLRVFSARWSLFYGRRRLSRTVLGCAALAIFALASVSACSSSSTPTTPPPFATGTPTPTPTPSDTSIPAEAPGTGGGGTAGFQHVLLFYLGVLAILAGAGGIAYRRKVMRDR